MSIGMTYDDYWHGEPEMAAYYRKAEKLRLDKLNWQLWFQGNYVYNAILDVAPVLHAFAKKGTKPKPYLSEPIPITKYAAEEKERRDQAEKRQKLREKFFADINKQKEAVKDGGND